MKDRSLIDRLMSEMTLAEKIGQLNLVTPGGETVTGATVNTDVAAKVRAGRIGGIFGVKSAAAVRAFQDLAMESRLRIPLFFAEDVIHGYRTVFPIPLGLSATWNMALVERTAQVAAQEATAQGIDQAYGPMVDVCRDPRWGRIAESPGEDPHLGARYAEAMVRGFQGEDLSAPDRLMACLKHFAAYGAAEGGRDYAGADMSPQRLRDVYLPPFAAGIAAGAGSVMAGFNTLNGVPMHANRQMLTKVLRDELGYQGLVVADYTGVAELMPHGVAADLAEAAALALDAGVDMDMVSEAYLTTLEDAVRSGTVALAAVHAACRRVLEAKEKLGLFDDPYRRLNGVDLPTRVLTPAHRLLAREAAAEACVLLENSGVLPLKRTGTVALVGPLAHDRVNMNGTWAVCGRPGDAVTVLEGLWTVAGPGVSVRHAKGANIVDDPVLAARLNVHDWGDLSVVVDERTPDEMIAEAVAEAERADVVVTVVGEAKEYSGESSSRTDLRLSESQRQLLRALKGTGKPLVVVVMTGRPLVLTEEREIADALLISWFSGTEAGHGIADVLFGDVAPSGRLPASFPYHEGQIPVSYAEPATGRPFSGKFEKFKTGYLDMPDGVPHDGGLYPFGFGLSYTSFGYGPLEVVRAPETAEDDAVVRIAVTNTGERAAREVVQLYVAKPVSRVSRPRLALRRFEKIALAPGERRELTFTLTAEDFSVSAAERLDDPARLHEPGPVEIAAGPDSRRLHRIRLDWPAATGQVALKRPAGR